MAGGTERTRKGRKAERISSPSLTAEQNSGITLQRERLKNSGIELTLILCTVPLLVMICLEGGSRYDSVSGVAHPMEHTNSTGTERFERESNLDDVLYTPGGQYGASTGTKKMFIWAKVRSSQNLADAAATKYFQPQKARFAFSG